MASHDAVIRTDEDRIAKAEIADAGGNLTDLRLGMGSGAMGRRAADDRPGGTRCAHQVGADRFKLFFDLLDITSPARLLAGVLLVVHLPAKCPVPDSNLPGGYDREFFLHFWFTKSPGRKFDNYVSLIDSFWSSELLMVTITSFVTENEVIAALNIAPPNPSAYVDFVEAYWKGVTPERTPHAEGQFCSALQEWADQESNMGGAPFTRNYLARAPHFKSATATPAEGWRLPDTISREEKWLIGGALASAHLRTLVDAWLETGREPNGSERPANRNLLKTAWLWHSVDEFVTKYLPSMHPSLDPSGLGLVIGAPEWDRPGAGDFFEAQEVAAQRSFVGIMAGDWNQRLCKCRYPPCGRYFVGAKLRQSYRHGTFCSREHRARASAEVITKARRSQGRRRLTGLAAEWLAKRGDVSAWQDDKVLKQRLAEFLSKETVRKPTLREGRKPVSVNWVTRNRAAIEQRRQAMVAGPKTDCRSGSIPQDR